MNDCYLAVDIGASSGRHILGWKEDGQLKTQEVYRFENGLENKDGHLCWDTEKLFDSILEGMRRCKEIGKTPTSMGIDTWAVDFVLMDENGDVLGQTVGYRDKRTEGMDDKISEIISPEKLYERTGIQKQIFNTIYQLKAVKENNPEILEKAKTFLMIPDYFHYKLTGKKTCEYTNATTTQLVSPEDKDWDKELLKMLGYPEEIFPPITKAGTPIGNLLPEIQEKVGFDCTVNIPATHDTGSAVISVPALEDEFIYISSGTWSLMGTECPEAIVNKKSMEANFTNEGGYDYRFRYLKNIMGLWMIQSVKKLLNDKYSFGELCDMAEAKKAFPSRVKVNDGRFLAPDNMITEIQNACREEGMPVPEEPGEIATVIYQSLAECYADTVKEIEEQTGKNYQCIYIIGGGSNAKYLNQLTANRSGKVVFAGPGEGTAIGNLVVQMLAEGDFWTVDEARECIFNSFPIVRYNPE